jgi:hypothetical protein
MPNPGSGLLSMKSARSILISKNGLRNCFNANWYGLTKLYSRTLFDRLKIKLFILSYVGMASAVGQIIEVPIIIRSLSDSMGMLQQDDLPIPFHDDFLMTLDIGAHQKDNNSRVVGKYDHAWWNGRKPRSLDLVEILNLSNITDCVDTHKKQLASSTSRGEIGRSSEISTWPSMPGPFGIERRSCTGPVPLPGPVSRGCSQCLVYHGILMNTIDDIHSINRTSNSLASTSKTQWFLDMRRASTFNLLNEAAVLKETASTSPATRNPNIVRRNAEQELERLRNLPVSSHKWTWGEILTVDNVLALRRSGTRPQNPAHSGYDLSLKDGRLSGDDSSHSHPASDGLYDEVPVEASNAPPFSNATDMPYFSRGRNMVYNPLRISPPTTSASLELPKELPAPAQSVFPASTSAPAPTSQFLAMDSTSAPELWSEEEDDLEQDTVPSTLAPAPTSQFLATSAPELWSEEEDEQDTVPAPAKTEFPASTSAPLPAPTSQVLTMVSSKQPGEDEDMDSVRVIAPPEGWSSGSEDNNPSNIVPLDLSNVVPLEWSSGSEE